MSGHSTTPTFMTFSGGWPLRSSLIARALRGKTLPDPVKQLIAYGAVGVETLFAASFGVGWIRGRPILDIDRAHPGTFKRPVVRFGGKRDNQVKIETFQFVELLERERLVPRNIDADLGHGGDRKRIELAFADAGGTDIDAAAEHLSE